MTKIKAQESNGKVLDCLQKAVDGETTSRNLYWARSIYWNSLGMIRLADYYLAQSVEDHAQVSADRMAFLGRQPAIDAVKVAAVEEDSSISDLMQVELKVEVELADSYAEWIKTAEQERDYVTRDLLIRVVRSTQEHVDWLQAQLRQIDLMGEDNYLAAWKSKRDSLL